MFNLCPKHKNPHRDQLCISMSYSSAMSTAEMMTMMTEETDTEVTSVSGSLDDVYLNYKIPWGTVMSYIIVGLLILFGNALVIAAVLRYRFLQSATNIFVAAVAVMDFCFGLALIFKVFDITYPHLLRKELPCIIRLTVSTVNGVANAFLLVGKCWGPF